MAGKFFTTSATSEAQILYIYAYTWDLEKWYRWTYLQGKNRDANVENEPVYMVGEELGWTVRLGFTYAHYLV